MVQLLIRTCINRVETNMPFTYQTFYEKVQTNKKYSMKRATTCGVHSYHVNGYFVQNLFSLNLLQHFLMCAMVFANMVSEKFRSNVFAKMVVAKMRQHNFFRFIPRYKYTSHSLDQRKVIFNFIFL
jgi:hypothetical protein